MNLAESVLKSEFEVLQNGQQLRYEPDEEDIHHIKQWAKLRHNSYADGETRNEEWGDSLVSMERGVAAELLLTLVYDECDFDEYVGADGDDGSDGMINIEGEILDFDVKASTTEQREVPFDVELLYAKHHMDERDVPPVLVSAYVAEDLSEIRLRGWIKTMDFLSEADVKDAYAGSHQNYALSVDDLEPMPTPTANIDDDDVETVWR